jgi:hypothetical protein
VEQDEGRVSPKERSVLLKNKLAPLLLKEAEAGGWMGISKKDLFAYVGLLDENLSGSEHEDLVTFAWNQHEKRRKQEKQVKQEHKPNYDFTDDFSITQANVLNEILNKEYENWNSKQRDVSIYQRTNLEGELNKDVANDVGIHPTYIPKINARVYGHLSVIMGEYREQYCEQKLINDGKYEEIIRDGRPGKPDIVCKSQKLCHIYSIKWTSYKNDLKKESKSEYRPEIELALDLLEEFEEIKVFVWYYNEINHENIIFEIEDLEINGEVEIHFHHEDLYNIPPQENESPHDDQNEK